MSSHGPQAQLLAFALPPALPSNLLSSPTFSQTVCSLPSSSSWSSKELALPSDLHPLILSLRSGSGDRSFKAKFGASAFTIVASTTCSVLGMNVVPGHPEDQSACRSELAGLHAAVFLVNLLCSWAGISFGSIEIGCNGLSALSKAFDSWPLEPAHPHFDMLSALWLMIASSPFTWTTRHVAGHQDVDPTQSEPRLFGAGKNSQPPLALAAISPRTLGKFGNVKNRLSSLFGPFGKSMLPTTLSVGSSSA
jgi:hypothetical protein